MTTFADVLGVSKERDTEIKRAVDESLDDCPRTGAEHIKDVAERLNVPVEAVYAGFQLRRFGEWIK